MTPTPSDGAIAQGAGSLWIAAIVAGILGAIFLTGLATGVIRLNPQRTRRAGGRAAVALDATLSPRDRRDALEYLLDDQHRVVMEQEHGDGDSDEEPPPVLYAYPDELDGEHVEAD